MMNRAEHLADVLPAYEKKAKLIVDDVKIYSSPHD